MGVGGKISSELRSIFIFIMSLASFYHKLWIWLNFHKVEQGRMLLETLITMLKSLQVSGKEDSTRKQNQKTLEVNPGSSSYNGTQSRAGELI